METQGPHASEVPLEVAGAEPWGAGMFARRIARRLQSRHVFEDVSRRQLRPTLPSTWNLLLLGPSGAGKSSLIYTMWRALRAQEQLDAAAFRRMMEARVQNLSLGWTVTETEETETEEAKTAQPKPLSAKRRNMMGRHGTQVLSAVKIMEPCREHSGIAIQDTKGQQFFDQKEQEYAAACVAGMLSEGSTLEQQHLRYWLIVGNIGFFSLASVNTSPHVIALVFDASLRSLRTLLEVDFDDSTWEQKHPQLMCYHKVIDKARSQHLDVFVVLTHVDEIVGKAEASEVASSDDRRIGEEALDTLTVVKRKLSAILSFGGRNIPPDHVFLMENYRMLHNTHDPRIELAALELLEALVDSADKYLGTNPTARPKCAIS